MAGFDNDVVYGTNIDLRGVTPVVGQFTAAGQLLIGAASSPYARVNTLTAGAGISITNQDGGIIITNTNGGGPTGGTEQLTGNAGVAVESGQNINVLGVNNITTTGAGATLSVSVTGTTNHAVQLGTAAGALNSVSGLGTSGQVLTSNGLNQDPTWQDQSTALTITGDSGGALSPTSSNWNILGQQAGTIAVMDTIGAASTLSIEDRTWQCALVVDPSATVGLRGTFQTITAALAAATAGQNIFIRPGTYTEDLTLKASVNLIAFNGDHRVPMVTIIGKLSASYTGQCYLHGIRLQTNNDFAVSLTGANLTQIKFQKCFFNVATANTAISSTGSNGSVTIKLDSCLGNLAIAGATYFNVTNGFFEADFCFLDNSSGSTTTSSISSAGAARFRWTFIVFPITATNTSQTLFYSCDHSIAGSANATCLILNNTGSNAVRSCNLSTGTATAMTIGVGASVTIADSIIDSSNAAAISGLGTLIYSGLYFINTASTNFVVSASTQTSRQIGPTLYAAGFAGNYMSVTGASYQALISDMVIGVNRAGIVTVTMPNTNLTNGQQFRIKDESGAANVNNITISGNGVNIDGAATKLINTAYGTVDLYYSGSQFYTV